MYAYVCLCVHACMVGKIRPGMYFCVCVHTYIHTNKHKGEERAKSHAYMHTHIHIYIHTCNCRDEKTAKSHAYMHTHIHTYIYKYIHAIRRDEETAEGTEWDL